MKCPECGKFLKDVDAQKALWDERISVWGICKTHGIVEPSDWEADDFVFEDFEAENP